MKKHKPLVPCYQCGGITTSSCTVAACGSCAAAASSTFCGSCGGVVVDGSGGVAFGGRLHHAACLSVFNGEECGSQPVRKDPLASKATLSAVPPPTKKMDSSSVTPASLFFDRVISQSAFAVGAGHMRGSWLAPAVGEWLEDLEAVRAVADCRLEPTPVAVVCIDPTTTTTKKTSVSSSRRCVTADAALLALPLWEVDAVTAPCAFNASSLEGHILRAIACGLAQARPVATARKHHTAGNITSPAPPPLLISGSDFIDFIVGTAPGGGVTRAAAAAAASMAAAARVLVPFSLIGSWKGEKTSAGAGASANSGANAGANVNAAHAASITAAAVGAAATAAAAASTIKFIDRPDSLYVIDFRSRPAVGTRALAAAAAVNAAAASGGRPTPPRPPVSGGVGGKGGGEWATLSRRKIPMNPCEGSSLAIYSSTKPPYSRNRT